MVYRQKYTPDIARPFRASKVRGFPRSEDYYTNRTLAIRNCRKASSFGAISHYRSKPRIRWLTPRGQAPPLTPGLRDEKIRCSPAIAPQHPRRDAAEKAAII